MRFYHTGTLIATGLVLRGKVTIDVEIPIVFSSSVAEDVDFSF
jgi:hypothetical protein